MYPDNLVVIGVHSAKFPTEQLTENIRSAVRRLEIHHPVVNDAGFKIWNSYAVRAWPTLVLIDPNGRIVGEHSGEIMAETMAINIEKVIAEHRESLNDSPVAEAEPETLEKDGLKFPSKLLFQPPDHCWVADTGSHRILQGRIDFTERTLTIERIYGGSQPGLVDGSPAQARFHHPHGMDLKGSPQDGDLYIADTENHAVRAINLSSGEVRTVAGTGRKGHGRIELREPTRTELRSPWAVTALQDYVFIAMAGSHQVWVILQDDQLGPFAGNGYEALVDGPIKDSSFNQPSDLSFGWNYLFVADPEASAVRAIELVEDAKTVTIVGQGLFDFGDVDGDTREALLQHPTGLVFHEDLLYIADTYNHKIKVLNPRAGQITTLAGSGQRGHQDDSLENARFNEPEGIQAFEDYLMVADTNNHALRLIDLNAKEVYTLELVWQTEPDLPQTTILPAITVPPGDITLHLEPRLPQGTKLHPDQEALIRLDGKWQAFPPGQRLLLQVSARQKQPLELDVTLYYCDHDGEGLCYTSTRSFELRLESDPAIPAAEPISLELPFN